MKPIFVLALLIVPLAAQSRVFTDDSGRMVDAELVGVRSDHVVLAKNGKAGRWPISKLSQADQIYVKAWMKDPPKTPQLRVRLFERDGIGESGVFQGETSKGPKSIPIIQETEAKAKYKYYQADITNDSQVDAMQLTVSYMLFIINTSNKIVPEAATQGIDKLEAGKRETVSTEAITFHRTKTTSLTLGTNIFGNLNVGSDTSRAKERFAGAWVRVYSQDGQLVGEAKKLIPELERLDLQWNGATGERDFPLLEAFDAFEKLIESLPKLPKPPEGLPEPPPGLPKPPKKGLPKPPKPPFGN